MSDWKYEINDGLVAFYESGIERNIDKVFDTLNAAEARIAELEAFIDRLIEVGEKMFTAVIAAADPYDEGMREWDKIVNGWKEG